MNPVRSLRELHPSLTATSHGPTQSEAWPIVQQLGSLGEVPSGVPCDDLPAFLGSLPVPLANGELALSWDCLQRTAEHSSALALRMVLGLLSALQLVHADPFRLGERYVSGVICPANVLITRAGRVLLATQRETVLPQPAIYRSPERRASGPVDRRADVYAVGVLLLEAIAARRLGEAELGATTPVALARDSRWQVHLRDPLLTIALRAVSPTPNHRWSSTHELRFAIQCRAAERVAPAGELGALVASQLDQQAPGALPEARALLKAASPLDDAPRVSGFHARAPEVRSLGSISFDGCTWEPPWDGTVREAKG